MSNEIEAATAIAGDRAAELFANATQYSVQVLHAAGSAIEGVLQRRELDPQKYCFIAVGSVGRLEAMECSDIDLIPVAEDEASLKKYEPHDPELRQAVMDALGGMKVSAGSDLTKAVSIESLCDPASIGGSLDSSSALTRRILIVTESQLVGGGLRLRGVREQVLRAYANAERTRGRHVLSFCNDIARYYRTLCIEYKAKVDTDNKDWCTRNLKLRHSRKFWYFANVASLATLAEKPFAGEQAYLDALLDVLELPPWRRLVQATGHRCAVPTRTILECLAYFLGVMAIREHRDALEKIPHEARYEIDVTNPFPALKVNSDLMHEAMITVIESVPSDVRRRIIDWFLL